MTCSTEGCRRKPALRMGICDPCIEDILYGKKMAGWTEPELREAYGR